MAVRFTVETWQRQAACRGKAATIFFPPVEDTYHHHRPGAYDRGRAICVGCEVRGHCLAYALRTGQKFGLWGGLTPAERKQLQRQNAC